MPEFKAFDLAIQHLKELLLWRLRNSDTPFKDAPRFDTNSLPDSYLKKLILILELQAEEQSILFLALAPYLAPALLKTCVNEVYPEGAELPELGGTKGNTHRGILPTGETVLFLLAGNNITERLQNLSFLLPEAPLRSNKVIQLEKVGAHEPFLSGNLVLQEDYVQLLLTGSIPDPELSIEFPAQKLTTNLAWEDLVLNKQTLNEIKELEIWLKHHEVLKKKHDLTGKFKSGYRALFYGPPGTGKTLTASLLGKYTGREVYRVDLSVVISKYIGETEKNLSKLFDKARYKNWILFFDEADAIFGKRTQVRDAHDKYANQEVSYLLQRLEEHPGLVILASNFKSNIDAAFTRRFQAIVQFTNPNVEERLKLWNLALPEGFRFAEEIDLKSLAKTYDITGANINNVVHYSCLNALNRKTFEIDSQNLIKGLKREYQKEEKMF
ncbi:ATP-binding protein [Leeuwenhoekiella parthenopeia]|uniref:ATP-binding protein n=1 Tax=Leeuwenhoekiella parthenopeia TaxID=2890320 RepID=A0ABS8GRN8_9FLAO|nr:ATP-binding protein [Leeuwenhoekiella parthenopeia]MCC4212589.1 ATP-binding protein [Leeuwenhoekiella parthenopeia]